MITNDKNKVIYISDGTQTEYYFDFIVYDPSHIKVYTKSPNSLVSSLLDLTKYSVFLNSDYSGGKVVLNSPLESNTEIAIVREVPLTQGMQYIEGDPFPAKSHEKALDLLTMICQQLKEKVDRALLKDLFDQGEINVSEFLANLQYFQDNYEDYLKSFGLVYLGPKDTPPTTRNDGAFLQEGDLYFDTTIGRLFVWNGTEWVKLPAIKIDTSTTPWTLKVWDETSQSFVDVQVNQAQKLQGYVPSLTSAPNTIPIADANGFINDWINQGDGSGLDADLIRGLPGDFTSSLAASGYQKLPSGLIVQWGQETLSVNGTTYTFPVAFPNACFGVLCNINDIKRTYQVNAYSITTSSFQAASDATLPATFNWIAIGY